MSWSIDGVPEIKVKVCGCLDPLNIQAISSLQPDFLGFIFYPASPRFVGTGFVMPEISPSIKKVGVFVSEKIDVVIQRIEQYQLDFVQLHGNESPEYCAQLKDSCGVIKAIGIATTQDLENAEDYANCCDYLLFDTKSSRHGGTGIPFDHRILENYQGKIPYLLSGGLDLQAAHHYLKHPLPGMVGIDVNSRFELAPGLKDINLIKQLLKQSI